MKRVTQSDGALIEARQAPGPQAPGSAVFLNRSYFDFQRRLAYPQSGDRHQWNTWRRRLRRGLRRTFCLDKLGPVPTPKPRVLEEVVAEGYTRYKVAYQTLPGSWVRAYLLVPEGGGKKPAAICPHGHVSGAKDGVVFPAGAPGVAYGHELARRGVVVLAPDNAGMGERDSDVLLEGARTGCWLVWCRLNQMGLDLTGFRLFELMAGINLLLARQDVDKGRLGAAGLSGGCWLAQALSALDRRIKAVVLSGFFTTFVQTVWHGHCICHHPFGIGQLCDMPDLSALIAPRHQFVESGSEDTNYPHEPAFSLVHQAYQWLGVPQRLGLDRYEGGHLFRGEVSIPWLVEVLRG